MKQLLLLVLTTCLSTISPAQNLNVTFRSQLTYPGQTCANICGYVDHNGNEYALVGASVGLSIVNVTNPSVPVQVYQHIGPTGSSSLWQEIKVRGDYAYVTTEAGGGLQIFNLSSLPNTAGITMVSYTGDGTIAGQLNTIHALHIDNNFVYLYGTNLFNGGAVALDVTSPMSPVFSGHYSMGAGNAQYVHDGYVRNDTMYAGHIYQGYFSVVDFSNKSNPIELVNQQTPNNFTHNTWLNESSHALFTTDEVSASYLTSYDISDLNNIKELDKIQSNPGSGSIVHNVHIIKVNGAEYAVTSWYRDGFTITDVTRPHNLIQVGNYDTYSGSGDGFDGDWGVYPFLPSGTIVVSNINEGLFVFSPNYQRACYLEGTVTDSITGFPLNNVKIEINSTSVIDYSKANGDYATGIPAPGGTYSVTYSKPGYYSKTIANVNLSAGAVFNQDVQLSALPRFTLYGNVSDASNAASVANAKVRVVYGDNTFNLTTDASGNFSLSNVYEETFSFTAGKWGYKTNCAISNLITSTTNTVNILLNAGYYDDFSFDFGWTISGNASTGAWVRAVPNGTFNNGVAANPGADVLGDCGTTAFITGNNGSTASDDDIDGGSTILASPIFDVTAYATPQINFSYWFYNAGGSGTPNDSLNVYLSNGTTIQRVYSSTVATVNNSSWVNKSVVISQFINTSSTMRIYVRAADANPGNIVEAGFDRFEVVEGVVGINEQYNFNNEQVITFPNPTTGKIQLLFDKSLSQNGYQLSVFDVLGNQLIQSLKTTELSTIVDLTGFANGIYFIQIKTEKGIINKKVVKQ
jgi:choice-of-anchor B domain-containing protein